MTLRAFFYVAMGIQFTNFAFSTKYDGHLTFTHFCTCLNRFHVGVQLNIYEQLQNQSIMLVLNITSQICMSCKQSFSIRCRMRGGRESAQNTNSSLSCTNLHLQKDCNSRSHSNEQWRRWPSLLSLSDWLSFFCWLSVMPIIFSEQQLYSSVHQDITPEIEVFYKRFEMSY